MDNRAKPSEPLTLPLAVDARAQHDDTNHYIADSVADVIANYKPTLPSVDRTHWAVVEEFTRAAITDFKPRTADEARFALRAVARLAVWSVAVAQCPLTREEVFEARNISSFLARGLPTHKDKSRQDVHGWLTRVASELGFETRRRRLRTRAARGAQNVYSMQELTAFRAMGRNRRSSQQCHNWMVLLTLCAGAGLGAEEAYFLRPSDIIATGSGFRIDARGERARTVHVAADWCEELQRLLDSPLTRERLYFDDVQRKNVAMYIANKVFHIANGEPYFTTDRLVGTWTYQRLLAGVPVDVIMRVRGFVGLDALDKFVALIPARPAMELEHYLTRAAR